MKLGEALSLRAKQAQQLADLRGRISANALVQEGDSPSEDPEVLLDEYVKLSEGHAELVRKIALTNTTATVGGTDLLTLLHRREALRRNRGVYEMAASAATPTSYGGFRLRNTELRMIAQLTVPECREKAEEYDAQVRELDTTIQEANWRIDLL